MMRRKGLAHLIIVRFININPFVKWWIMGLTKEILTLLHFFLIVIYTHAKKISLAVPFVFLMTKDLFQFYTIVLFSVAFA